MTMLRMLFAAGLVGMLLCEAQSATPEKFDVASVKINPYSKTSCIQDARGCSNLGAFGGSTFTAANESLEALIELAYHVDQNQLLGTERLPQDRFDISARPATGTVGYERIQPMLRALLEERFELKTHRENREFSGYALVVAKGGPKLKAAGDTPRPFITYPGDLEGSPAGLNTLASMLTNLVKRPVVNKTGIDGNYDLRLRFARDDDTKSTLPSLFTAIQEQLGLRLESQKVQIEMLSIDSCNRMPVEN